MLICFAVQRDNWKNILLHAQFGICGQAKYVLVSISLNFVVKKIKYSRASTRRALFETGRRILRSRPLLLGIWANVPARRRG